MHAAEGGLLFDHMATPEGLDIPPIFEEAFLNETVLSIGAAGAGLVKYGKHNRELSRTPMGCFVPFSKEGRSNPSVASRCSSLLPSLSADGRSFDDVIAGCPFTAGEINLLSFTICRRTL